VCGKQAKDEHSGRHRHDFHTKKPAIFKNEYCQFFDAARKEQQTSSASGHSTDESRCPVERVDKRAKQTAEIRAHKKASGENQYLQQWHKVPQKSVN
jgi:hypothetical protein